jgi:hypothetical protein
MAAAVAYREARSSFHRWRAFKPFRCRRHAEEVPLGQCAGVRCLAAVGERRSELQQRPSISVRRCVISIVTSLPLRHTLNVPEAASGDIRNVVKTIAGLPTGFTQRIELYINDIDLGVVARNLILLLLSLIVEDDKEAVECMIHVWYSSFLRARDMTILRDRLRPMIEDICRKIQDKPSTAFLGKTWHFGSHSCRIELTKASWGKVLLYLDNIKSLTTERAHQIRSTITLAPERVDYWHRHFLALTPAHRLCKQRFREDGLLLPFGSSRLDFKVPNP